MCGIAGFLSTTRALPLSRLHAMVAALAHRGPDGVGALGWRMESGSAVASQQQVHVALGHRRLAIVDLSADGQEPMCNEDGAWWLTYNGEIYNHLQLRTELLALGHTFRSHCDAEVLLHGMEQWGAGVFERLEGMYAAAMVHLPTATLWLARDPVGIKPLLVAQDGDCVAFASEGGGLEAGGFGGPVDPEAVSLFVALGFVPWPLALQRNMTQVAPGQVLRVVRGAVQEVTRVALTPVPHRRKSGRLPGAVAGLQDALGASVASHLQADVEVGVLLSGGVDSAVVASLAVQHQPGRVQAFTLAVDHPAMDESAHAAQTAARLGVEHHVRKVTAADALARLPSLLASLDQPVADPSILPTRLVCELAAEHVKVVLSGDGGDELLGGYVRHRLWLAMRQMRPLSALAPWGTALTRLATDDRINRAYNRLAPTVGLPGIHEPARKLRAALASLAEPASVAYARTWRTAGTDELRTLGLDDAAANQLLLRGGASHAHAQALSLAQHADLLHWLPDDILFKVDRASMAVGLEARVPLLSAAVVRFCAGLHQGDLMHRGQGKHVLRQLAAQRVNADIAWARKRGFGLPLRQWLATDLRAWREDLLGSLAGRGTVSARGVRNLQDAHDGGTDHAPALFALCALESWLRPRC